MSASRELRHYHISKLSNYHILDLLAASVLHIGH
jgi:hypothetical protein